MAGGLLLMVAHTDREEDGVEVIRISLGPRSDAEGETSYGAESSDVRSIQTTRLKLTAKLRAEVEALKARPDSEIDTSDIPEAG